MELQKTGKFISLKRKEHSLTQEQFAEKLGVTNKAVSKWERGICYPDIALFEPICDILEISIEELIKGESISKENIPEETKKIIIDLSLLTQKLKAVQKIIIYFFIGIVLSLVSEQLPDLLYINMDEQSQFIQGLLDGISTGLLIIGSMMIVAAFVSLYKYISNKKKSRIQA